MYHSIVISWCFSEVSYVPAQVWLHSASESLRLSVMADEDKEKHSFEPSNTVVLHLSQRNWRILTIAYLNAAILVRSPEKNSIEESLNFCTMLKWPEYPKKCHGNSWGTLHAAWWRPCLVEMSTFMGTDTAVCLVFHFFRCMHDPWQNSYRCS